MLHCNIVYNPMPIETEILIIGGGLAGLISAIHLKKLGFDVVLIEKHSYPHHKVCGEYISNEVLPYFKWLDINLELLLPTNITHLQFSSFAGKSINSTLPLGGFGLSRYTIDYFLFQTAISRGVNILQDTVLHVAFTDDHFLVETAYGKSFSAKHAIGAYGKRSAIDAKLGRNFIHKKSPFLAVKAHYQSDFPNHLVSLNNFPGGYCGVSKVEDDKLNICYLANYESFKKYKSIVSYQENVLYKNKNLRNILTQATIIFEAPLSISQVSFEKKEPVYNHILMVGDTAGLIHPLCGNGMAMAIHSAKIAVSLIDQYTRKQILTRAKLEKNYTESWNKLFANRLKMGRMLSSILSNELLERLAMNSITWMPFLLNKIIKHTHGEPIKIHD